MTVTYVATFTAGLLIWQTAVPMTIITATGTFFIDDALQPLPSAVALLLIYCNVLSSAFCFVFIFFLYVLITAIVHW